MKFDSAYFRDEIFYLRSQDTSGKPPLVMLMGYSGSTDSWTPGVLDRLAERWPVIAVDTIGTGRSAKDIDSQRLEYPAVAKDLRDLLHSLGHEQAHLLGYSYGGTVAMSFLHHFPEACGSLVLVSTTLGGEDYISPPAQILEKLASPPGETVTEKTASIWKLCLGEENFPEFQETMQAMLEAQMDALTPSWILEKQLKNYLGFRFRSQAEKAALPVTVMTGDEDPLTPPENSERLAGAFPNASLVRFRGCRHMPHVECPERYCGTVIEHLDSIRELAD